MSKTTTSELTVARLLVGVVLMLAFVAQCVVFVGKSEINPDEMLQIGVSQSIARGHNQTIPVARSLGTDASRIDQVGSIRLPPGYGVFHAVVRPFVENPRAVDRLIDIIGTFAFLLGWMVILCHVMPWTGAGPALLVSAVMLVFPASIVAMETHSSQIMSIGLFNFALSLVLLALSAASLASHRWLMLAAGLALGVATAWHYTYWSLTVVLPLAALPFLRFKRKKQGTFEFMAMALFVIGCSAILIPVALNNIALTGAPVRTGSPGLVQWAWSQLGYVTPFPGIAMGVFAHAFDSKAEILKLEPASIASILVLLCYGVWLWRVARAQKSPDPAGVRYLAMVSIVVLVVVIAFLGWLSVSSKMWGIRGLWTYVAETRYYSPSFIFLVLAMAVVALGPTRKSGTAKILSYLAMAGFAVLMALQLPQRAKDLATAFDRGDTTRRERQFVNRINTFQTLAARTPELDIVLYSPGQNHLRNVALASGLPVAVLHKDSVVVPQETVNLFLYITQDTSKSDPMGMLSRSRNISVTTVGKDRKYRKGVMRHVRVAPSS